jgi:hypothetical protein
VTTGANEWDSPLVGSCGGNTHLASQTCGAGKVVVGVAFYQGNVSTAFGTNPGNISRIQVTCAAVTRSAASGQPLLTPDPSPLAHSPDNTVITAQPFYPDMLQHQFACPAGTAGVALRTEPNNVGFPSNLVLRCAPVDFDAGGALVPAGAPVAAQQLTSTPPKPGVDKPIADAPTCPDAGPPFVVGLLGSSGNVENTLAVRCAPIVVP